MLKLLPRTLFGQLMLALALGLLAVQLFAVWIMFGDRTRLAEHLLAEHAANRIAGVAAVLDAADAIDRAKLARALDVPPTRIELSRSWQENVLPAPESAELAGTVARHLERPLQVQVIAYERLPWLPRPPRPRDETPRPDESGRGPPLPADTPRDAIARHEPPPAGPEAGPPGMAIPGPAAGRPDAGTPDRPAPPPPGGDVHSRRGWRVPILQAVVQVRLHDGAVATIHHALPDPPIEGPVRFILGVIASGIFISLLAGWTVRRLTRPFSVFARAASGLAGNLDQPPIPEAGPLEVSSAASAFNRMQRDLKRLVDTRASALAAVSHDLRLPITRVRLRLENAGDDKLKRDIEGDLAEMDAMIGHTLEFLRAGASGEKPVRANLDALIDGVVEDAEALGAKVSRTGTAREPIVVRPQALRRCLANLLENARRYGGGAIDLEVRDSGSRVEIGIGDRGPGIPAADRERVFEPYVRLEASRAREFGGTGLGLAIARAVARSHGGDVAFADRVGGGLMVLVTLSRSHFPPSPATA